jgi:ADP-heptose:LPS heptosyltransferase
VSEPAAGRGPRSAGTARAGRDRVLVARLDNAGDALPTGPAVRAIAARADVVYLCGPRGTQAAEMLPGVRHVTQFHAPWMGDDAPPVDRRALRRLRRRVASWKPGAAVIFTSSHQSPLPLALVLRSAGVEMIAANSVDHPGSLLDLRRRPDPALHEVEQNLALARDAGFPLPPGASDALAIRAALPRQPFVAGRYVVVHPGASVPARGLPAELARSVVAGLSARGTHVVVTGSPDERRLTALVAAGSRQVTDLAGALTFATLASVLAGADALVTGNTGPAHLAAAVGTPVVCVFAPVVPAHRWRPWRVRHVLLGDQEVACAGCRSRRCPLADQLCVSSISADSVIDAVASVRRASLPGVRTA